MALTTLLNMSFFKKIPATCIANVLRLVMKASIEHKSLIFDVTKDFD